MASVSSVASETFDHIGALLLLSDAEGFGPAVIRRLFYRWELAVAAAAVMLGVNPFDEPDVNEAKDLARRRLASLGRDDEPAEEPRAAERGLELYMSGETADDGRGDLASRLRGWIDRVDPDDYVAVLAYFRGSEERDRLTTQLRDALAARTGAAITLGYGPRYLHSTGQLHKGGRSPGAVLVLTEDATEEVPVPGAEYGFADLRRAQALGDADALASLGRPVARINLGWYVEDALAALGELLRPNGDRA